MKLNIAGDILEGGFKVFDAFDGDGVDVAELGEVVGGPEAEGDSGEEFFEFGCAFDVDFADGEAPVLVELFGDIHAGLDTRVVIGVAEHNDVEGRGGAAKGLFKFTETEEFVVVEFGEHIPKGGIFGVFIGLDFEVPGGVAQVLGSSVKGNSAVDSLGQFLGEGFLEGDFGFKGFGDSSHIFRDVIGEAAIKESGINAGKRGESGVAGLHVVVVDSGDGMAVLLGELR